jgi:hypothetical protein
MFIEASPTDQEGAVLLSRKGLTERASAGSGPVTGVFQQPGAFIGGDDAGNGDVLWVSGGVLYRDLSALGTIDGDGPVSFACGGPSEILVTAGASLWLYDGSTLSAVAFPDDADVAKVVFHDGLYIAVAKNTHRYYWSAVLDGSSWDGLDFASAESKPDRLLDIEVVNDTLWLFGEETTEPWANTGQADAPYQRFEQRIYSKGIRATGCVVEMDQGLFFISNESIAYSLREGPQRISDHGIEERIAASDSVSCFGFVQDGHSFFCVRLDEETYAYDIATQQWCELATYGLSNFRGQCATAPGDAPVFGDSESGKLFELGGWADDEEPLERLFTWAIPMDGGAQSIDSLSVNVNVGWTELLSGQGSSPIAELRTSRDAGATFGNWRSSAMGAQGEYRTRTTWRRLGMFDAPGALGEIRVTDPVGVRMSGVLINEPGGGRSR